MLYGVCVCMCVCVCVCLCVTLQVQIISRLYDLEHRQWPSSRTRLADRGGMLSQNMASRLCHNSLLIRRLSIPTEEYCETSMAKYVSVRITPTFGGGNSTCAALLQTVPTRALRWKCAIKTNRERERQTQRETYYN